MIRLETERLILRAPVSADWRSYQILNEHQEVTRYVGTKLAEDRAGIVAWIEGLAERFPAGSTRGVWVAELEGRFAGSFMLRPSRDTCELELGYRLLPLFWGRGLATEAARAMLSLAPGEKIIARAHAENLASIRVMERLGMQRARTYEFDGRPSVEYAILS